MHGLRLNLCMSHAGKRVDIMQPYHNSTLFEILLHAITQITLRGSSFYFTHIIMKVCINRK